MAKEFAVELLRTSALCFSGFDKSAIKNRTKMVLNGVKNRDTCDKLLFPHKGSALDKAMLQAPNLPGILVWPYQNSSWAVEKRLSRLLNHYSVVDQLDIRYRVTGEQKLQLFDLSDLFSELTVVVDQPEWFQREGGLSLNLFVGRFRAFSIMFSLFEQADGTREIYVGGIQGRSTTDVMTIYRSLTRALFGIRPRDMTIELLRMLALHWQVDKIRCVADECRHHRHPFFGGGNFSLNYNDVWKDRGGKRTNDGNYEIPLRRHQRCLADLPARKRSMYKKRYAFLEALEQTSIEGFPAAKLVEFVAN